MRILRILAEPIAGSTIKSTLEDCHSLSKKNNTDVYFKFNGVKFIISPSSDLKDMETYYGIALKMNSFEEKAL